MRFCEPAERSVHQAHLPGAGLLRDPHDLDRLPLLDHLLERLQHLHRGPAEALIECIVAQHPWLENDCLMADIILPASTRFEMLDIGNDIGSGVFTSVFLEDHCIDPVGESLCDFDIVAKIAEKLGLHEEYTQGKTHEEKQKLAFEGSGVDELIILGGAAEEAVLRHPLRRPTSRTVPPGLSDVRQRPQEQPADHPHRPARVLLLGPREALPRRPRAAAGGRTGSRRARATTSA